MIFSTSGLNVSGIRQVNAQVGNDTKFTGSQINYYFICTRKLWFFSHNIELEQESDLVKLGALLHQNRYKRKMKEVQVDRIKIDFVESKRMVATPTGTDEAKREPPSSTEPSDIQIEPQHRLDALPKKELVIHEVKRSKKMQDAHLYQLLYYMYWLKENYRVNISRGILHYPLLNQNVDVTLTEDRIKQIQEAMLGIAQVNSQPKPPEATWKGYCRSCAYRDLCWG